MLTHHRVILESAGGSFGSQTSLANAERQGAALVDDIAVWRAMPAEDVIARLPQASAIHSGAHFYPNIDGHIVPEDPLAVLAGGRIALPTLIGFNSDEALFWSHDLPATLTGYRDYTLTWFAAGAANEVISRYPAASDAEVPKTVARMASDFKIITPTTQMARGVSRVAPVYLYRFSRVSPGNRATFGGAAHTIEIPYVFGLPAAETSQYEQRDTVLSQEVAGAWAEFIKNGDPGGAGLPEWPVYQSPDYRLIEYGDTTRVVSNIGDAAVAFFEATPAIIER